MAGLTSDKKNNSDILLESGTNEVEILEFTISGQNFGINVAKIKNLMSYEKITPMPNANPYIEGVFKPMNEILTIVNLPAYLGLPPSEETNRDIIIITQFNKNMTAFHVHSVEDIHRITWSMIEKPNSTIYGNDEGLITGIARIKNKLVAIIDFEKILAELSPDMKMSLEDVNTFVNRAEITKPIIVVEDSPLLEKLLLESLEKAGYSNVVGCMNGVEAWSKLEEIKRIGGSDISKYVTCVITDIEMPLMDGHRLTKMIREDAVLSELPVIIFSSLINDQMREKGKKVGATAQISKPEIASLIQLIDKYAL